MRDFDPAQILAGVPDGDINKLLAARADEQRETLAELVVGLPEAKSFGAMATLVDSSGVNSSTGDAEEETPWPSNAAAAHEWDLHSTAEARTKSGKVLFALVPVTRPNEIPALLGFGGWNACPSPEEIVAVLREWNRRFGAVPAAVTGDVLECFVERPPQTGGEGGEGQDLPLSTCGSARTAAH